ncbi:MAG: 2,5-didehydrogluconate reductase [Acidimicrobiales bacterium]|nr:2,5-didehydrogluconate reductase [Acidimicrobiales bacterium]
MTTPAPVLDIQGTTVPAIGYGTWMLEGDDCRTGVLAALELGYRHIDTAQVYGNEHLVGEAMVASGVPRGDVFLTTKIWTDDLTPHRIRPSFHESLEKLRTDHVDLLLMHWPVHLDLLEANLAVFQELAADGTARHIGVSNFTPPQLERALAAAPLFTNQVEHHPYLAQPRLREMSLEHEMLFTAYSPLARGEVLGDPVVVGIAAARDATPAQVVLRWLLDEGPVAVIPKGTSRAHAEENLAAASVFLSDEDRTAIAALDRNERQVDPPWAPDWER